MLSRFRQFILLTLNGAPVRSATERHADPEDKSSESVRKKAAKTIARVSFWMLSVVLALMTWSTPGHSASKDANTQSARQEQSALAQLYQLQAAFHRAASVHDPVNGDSPEVIEQRIREMLSLWTEDGALVLSVGGALDGTYAGQGDPDDLSTCPTPSMDPANRGTLCTFFKYVAGSFQPQNKFVSLAPAYKTHFHVNGNTASVYFECHYFNVATDPTTGNPLWTAASHVSFDGSAARVNGTWLFSRSTGKKVGIPIL